MRFDPYDEYVPSKVPVAWYEAAIERAHRAEEKQAAAENLLEEISIHVELPSWAVTAINEILKPVVEL